MHNELSSGENLARALALIVAAVFAGAPFTIWLMLPDGDEISWRMCLLAIDYVLGAGLLAAGASRWYGKKARLLRVWGFVFILVGALANVSLAFALVPVALVAALSLGNRVRRTARA